jgi:hypothetical protein
MPNVKKSFWTNPAGFSIVDLLSLSYSSVYLMIIICNVFYQTTTLTDLLQTMSPTVLVILGGYFTGQAVQQFNLTRTYRSAAVEEEQNKQLAKNNAGVLPTGGATIQKPPTRSITPIQPIYQPSTQQASDYPVASDLSSDANYNDSGIGGNTYSNGGSLSNTDLYNKL